MHSVARSSADRRRAGFTMVESLAATALLGATLLALGGASVSLTRTMKASDSTSVAQALAQQKLEELRGMPLGALQVRSGTYADPQRLRADGTPGGSFARSWRVSAPNVPLIGVKTIVVTVAWTDSRPRSTRLAAYVRCQIPCLL